MRKALEFPLALWIDLVLSKRRILEIYLNIAEWGPNGEFGVEAGSRYAFGALGARPVALSGGAARRRAAQPVRDRDAHKPGPGLRRLAGLYVGRARRARRKSTACIKETKAILPLALAGTILYKPGFKPTFAILTGVVLPMAVPKRKTSPSRRGMRRSADALKRPTYVEDKDSGELRRPHHIDLKTGMYKGRQVLKVKTEA